MSSREDRTPSAMTETIDTLIALAKAVENMDIGASEGYRINEASYTEACDELQQARAAVLARLESADRMRTALGMISTWDCLNPPRPDLLADLPWLRGVVDDALRGAS